MIIKSFETADFLDSAASPRRRTVRAVLLYGPDVGLSREYADRLTRSVVPDPADPFRTATLDAAALKDDPALLMNEIAAASLIGGQRVVRVTAADDALTASFKTLFVTAPGEALAVVLGAETLRKKSSLVKLFEAETTLSACIACYPDESASIAELARTTLAQDRIVIDGDALRQLSQTLGADRALVRSELEKLTLYVGPGQRATLEDVSACIGDSADYVLDSAFYAAAGGDAATLETALTRLRADGVEPVALLRMGSAHFLQLLRVRTQIDDGASIETALHTLKPPLFWKRIDAFRTQAKRWSPARSAAALRLLLDAEARCKTTATPPWTLCAHVLHQVAALTHSNAS